MSQVTDYSIANASGATVRADLNNVLAAIASANSGTAEPTTMYPFMIWVDTTNNLIKLRNGANDGWLTLPIAMNASNTAPSNLNVLGNLGVGSATTPAELIHAIASSGDANIRMEGTAVRLKKSGEDFIVYDGSNLKFETDGTEAARFDGNQRFGIGTSSPDCVTEIAGAHTSSIGMLHLDSTDHAFIALDAAGATNDKGIYFQEAGTSQVIIDHDGSANQLRIHDGSSTHMVITDGGSVGINTTSPWSHVSLNTSAGSTTGYFGIKDTTWGGDIRFGKASGINNDAIAGTWTGNNFAFYTNSVERMRITDGGAFLVGTTSTTINTSNFGAVIFADGRPKFSKNVTGGSHVMNVYGNAGEFRVYGDGDVQNTNNSYAGISDQSVKENIVDATDKLEDLKQVQIRNYNLIDDDLKQIGVIAQELEPIFPGLIKECNETGIKAVKYSVFVPILIKAIQELEERVAELEAA